MSKETCPKCRRKSLETRPNGATYCLYATTCAHYRGKPKSEDILREVADDLAEALIDMKGQFLGDKNITRVGWPNRMLQGVDAALDKYREVSR